ncbi:tetraspanin-17 [Lingula anatina]|uniref:Tetraspanin n=1 Tax=Lingula anatina TaxID=7574 RepID=A0A1S3H8X0_LINAN|nr:tetraspanin-17 [Lingula anatina]|eukprot:XP_013381926.1 tetraspanin-17 [Lingula anatina]
MAKRRSKDTSEVSLCIKYLVFGFNVFFWLIGAGVAAIGIWAWSEKDMFNNISKLTGNFILDPALIFMIVGGVIFIIGFLGCVGALRENRTLLLIFCVLLGIIFLAEVVVGVLGFVYKDWLKEQITEQVKKFIINYREDPDLQNLIDWVQESWLLCCGASGPNDWNLNPYFNCSSPSAEECGVPFSCCKGAAGEVIVNKQCGFGVRKNEATMGEKIYTTGCVAAGETWLMTNLIPVAGVAVGVALLQILGICFAQNLRNDIEAQRSKWERTR